MNKKLIVALSVVILVLVGFGVYSFARSMSDDSTESNTEAVASEEDVDAKLKEACEILNSGVAVELLGEDAVRDERLDEEESVNDEIVVSKCAYKNDQDIVINLVLRSSRSDNGSQLNKSVFDEAAGAKGVETIEGYGDKSFWNPEFGQFNILVGGEWYNLEYGSILPSKRTILETKEFADLISNNL